MTRKRLLKKARGRETWNAYVERTIIYPAKVPKKTRFVLFTKTVAEKALKGAGITPKSYPGQFMKLRMLGLQLIGIEIQSGELEKAEGIDAAKKYFEIHVPKRIAEIRKLLPQEKAEKYIGLLGERIGNYKWPF